MFEKDMNRLWMSPESFKELRLTLEADKISLEKQPVTFLIYMVYDSLSR